MFPRHFAAPIESTPTARARRWLGAAAFCLAQPALGADAAPGEPLRFGILNQQSPIQTAGKWNPILRYLSAKTGLPLRLKMGADVALTDAMMGREEFDLVYSNHNFQREYDGKYKVLAHWAGQPIRAAIVVLADSPARTLDDIRDATVAFPSPDAFAGYAVQRVALRHKGIAVREKFAGNQEGALAQLKTRQALAAAVNARFLDAYARREQLRYRTIYLSEPYLDLPISIHPRVPAEQADRLKQALLGICADPAAAGLPEAIRCPGFAAAVESDYDNVRRIYRAIGK